MKSTDVKGCATSNATGSTVSLDIVPAATRSPKGHAIPVSSAGRWSSMPAVVPTAGERADELVVHLQPHDTGPRTTAP